MKRGPDDIGQRSETVRRANLSAIVRELHGRGPASRSQLVTRTGLTRSAIRALIGELAAAGLVSEEQPEPLGTPGRPSPVVRADPDAAVVLALEIAVDSLAVAVVGLGGKVHEMERIDRPRRISEVDDVLAELAHLADIVRARRPGDDAVIGIGVAVAGLVRRSDGFLARAPNLGWSDVALAERVAVVLETSIPIGVGNDGDLGALAEHRRGAAVGIDHVTYISGEVGVGGGIIVDGRPLTGAAGYGGEVGHFPVDPDGRPCGCGSVGCWETRVGEAALLRLAGRPPDGGRAAIDALLADAAAGAPDILAALDETGRWLGIGLAGLINIFDPTLVVLGGLFGRIHPFVVGPLETELARRTLPASLGLVRVVPAALGVDAPLIGAAELAFEPLLADPATWTGPRYAVGADPLGQRDGHSGVKRVATPTGIVER